MGFVIRFREVYQITEQKITRGPRLTMCPRKSCLIVARDCLAPIWNWNTRALRVTLQILIVLKLFTGQRHSSFISGFVFRATILQISFYPAHAPRKSRYFIVARQQVCSGLTQHPLPCTVQHGFPRHLSCLTKLLCFLDEVTRRINKGMPMKLFCSDFSW